MLLLIIAFQPIVLAQRYDSLQRAIQKSTSDTLTIRLYHLLSEETRINDISKAIAYEDSALVIAKKIKSAKHVSQVLTSIGSIHRRKGENAKACQYFREALDASPHFSPWLGETYLEAGLAILRMSNYDSATAVLKEGLSLVNEHPDDHIEASLYNAMGNVKREQNQYEEALSNYIQSIKLFEIDHDQRGLAQATSNAGNIHNLMGNTDKALDYAKQSLDHAKAAGVKSSMAYSLRLLGQIYRRQGNTDESLNMYQQAVTIYRELLSKRDVGETELSIGNIYFDKVNYKKALEHYSNALSASKSIPDTLLMNYVYLASGITLLYSKDYDKAKAYMDTTITISKIKNFPTPRMDSYQVLSEIYEAEGNYKESLRYYRDYITLRDSVTKVQNRQEAEELEAKFESEKKDDAIRLLNAENSLKTNQQKYLLLILALLLSLAGILYSRYKVKQRANEKLKELDLVKSRFFINISHEFRTPLSLILGPLEKKLTVTDDGEEKESLKLMHRNARRLQNLINELLDLSRIEAGSMELHLEESDIAQTLRLIGSSFSSLAERKGIFYKQEILSSYMGCYDRDKLEKIVNNLLSNAFKFTPEGGLVHFKAQVMNGQLTVEIKDSGIGIPKEQQQNIFNRFYRIDDSTTRTSEGSGIGLALTKELTELHRGKLSLTSSEGIGSIFILNIPIKREDYTGFDIQPSLIHENVNDAGAEHHSIEAINEDESKPLILVAEDNHDMQKFIVDLLKESYRVIPTLNGKEAFDRSMELVPDLIISDWMMPIMDGRLLCEKLKTTDATSHIPVLMLTARADQPSKLEGLETGADDYLTKPFDAKELLVRSHNLIEQRKKLRQLFSREMVLQPKQILLGSRDEEFLSRLLTLLEEKYSKPDFSVEEIADGANMSRMQLHRKMKALTDQSPGEFLRRFRLEKARQMLLVPGIQVSEVCYKTGFNNLSNFSKIFREFTGVLPSDYQSSVSEKQK